MRLSYRQHLLEYFIYGIRQRIIFDKKTYIPIGDSYKEEFMKYISQKSIFLRRVFSCKGKMRPGTARVFPCLP